MANANYVIVIQGRLRPEWSSWFDGMTVDSTENGDTILTGLVRDQAALHGILNRIRDLNLTLIEMKRMEQGEQDGF